MRNSEGPSTVPCGTPEVTVTEEEYVPFKITFWVQFVKNLLIHL